MADGIGFAELHVHLEGTVRHETAIELARAHGLPAPPAYRYSTLARFLDLYRMVCAALRTASDFERVIGEHGDVMARDGIRYAEVSFNPSLHPGDGWLPGLEAGRRRVAADHHVEIAWLVELVRGDPPQSLERSLEIAMSTEGVVGLGLVGDESVSARPLAPLIQRARGRGLRFMPHAGQGTDPSAVREAIDILGAERIAHGVASATDPALMRELARREICLCVCPSSNRRIGLHPDIGALAAAGIALTVNTDDPAMVPANLPEELVLATREFGLDREQLIASGWRHRFSES
jgi:adenosine deaminase